jgi:hypothetical protein
VFREPLLCTPFGSLGTRYIDFIRPLGKLREERDFVAEDLGKAGVDCCLLFFLPVVDRDDPGREDSRQRDVIPVDA